MDPIMLTAPPSLLVLLHSDATFESQHALLSPSLSGFIKRCCTLQGDFHPSLQRWWLTVSSSLDGRQPVILQLFNPGLFRTSCLYIPTAALGDSSHRAFPPPRNASGFAAVSAT
ncbi:hypothetical protein FJTKL_11514 [Diaporthe vaccinii]|uniref:Uncharacterized protein n=1 Tax=Diaporthe vaccinii TaxID=105482 RepID=A0ABR4EGU7_9PEZI